MTKRKTETWTFQPDDDVIILVKTLFGEKPSRGDRTRLVNEAIRFSHPETAMMMAEQEVAEANARLERMKKMLAELKKISSNDKTNAVLGKSRAKSLNKRGVVQPTEKAALPNLQPPQE